VRYLDDGGWVSRLTGFLSGLLRLGYVKGATMLFSAIRRNPGGGMLGLSPRG
jgi:hypothetical protein